MSSDAHPHCSGRVDVHLPGNIQKVCGWFEKVGKTNSEINPELWVDLSWDEKPWVSESEQLIWVGSLNSEVGSLWVAWMHFYGAPILIIINNSPRQSTTKRGLLPFLSSTQILSHVYGECAHIFRTAAVAKDGEASLKSDLLKISQITALCIHSCQKRRYMRFISSNNAKGKTQRNGIRMKKAVLEM